MYVSMYQYKCSIEHDFGNSTNQSERVYYLSYFIMLYVLYYLSFTKLLLMEDPLDTQWKSSFFQTVLTNSINV